MRRSPPERVPLRPARQFEDLAEGAGAALVHITLEHVAKLGFGRKPSVLRLRHRALELVRFDGSSEIEEGPRRTGEGQRPAAADIGRAKLGSNRLDATVMGAPSGRDRDPHVPLGWVREDLPQIRGGSVAEDGTVAAGQDGRHLGRVRMACFMPDEVDATVDLDETASREAGGDLLGGNAALDQLPPSDYAELPTRKPRDHAVRQLTAWLTPHTGVNPALDASARQLGV